MLMCTKRPTLPVTALVNDNWIGHEKANVREDTVAENMLLSLGRACWKQVRLGKGTVKTVLCKVSSWTNGLGCNGSVSYTHLRAHET